MSKSDSKPVHSDAYFVDNLLLRHERSQHVYERCGKKVIDALFGIAVILPNISKNAEINEVSAIVKKTIEDAFNELRTENARVEKLLADNGVTIKAQYKRPRNVAVHVTTPRAGSFVALVRLLDEILVGMDKLWFAEVWDEAQKRKAVRTITGRVLAVATQIFVLHKRAYLARQRKDGTTTPTMGATAADPVSNAGAAVPAHVPPSSPGTPKTPGEITPAEQVSEQGKALRRKKAVAV